MNKSRVFFIPKELPFYYNFIPPELEAKLRIDDVLCREETFMGDPVFHYALYNCRGPYSLVWSHESLFIPLKITKKRVDALHYFEDVRKSTQIHGCYLSLECTPLDKGLVDLCGKFDHRWLKVMIQFRHGVRTPTELFEPTGIGIMLYANLSDGQGHCRFAHNFENKELCEKFYNKTIDDALLPLVYLAVFKNLDYKVYSEMTDGKVIQQSSSRVDIGGRIVIEEETFDATKVSSMDVYGGSPVGIDEIEKKIIAFERARTWRAKPDFYFDFRITRRTTADQWYPQGLTIFQSPHPKAQWRNKQLYLDLLEISIVFASKLPIYHILWIADWLPGMIYWKEYDKIRLIGAVKARVDQAMLRRESNSKKKC